MQELSAAGSRPPVAAPAVSGRGARQALVAVVALAAGLAGFLTSGPGLGSAAPAASAAVAAPVVSRIAPTSGAPGTVVTVRGANLGTGTRVLFGGVVATPTGLAGGGGITVDVPGGLSVGPVSLDLSNSGGPVTTATFQVLAPLAVTTTAFPAVEAGQVYSAQLEASGGAAPYHWSSGATLPGGLTLNRSGQLSGRPTTPGSTVLVVTVTDAHDLAVSASLPFGITAGPSITTTAIPDGTVGGPYSVTLSATGGAPPYLWSIDSGPIPGGLLLTSFGLLTGQPGAAGATQVAVRVTDSLGAIAVATFPVAFAPPPPPPQSVVLATTGGELRSFVAAPLDVALPTPAAGARLPARTVGVAAAPGGTGYWAVSSTGRVTAVGSARIHGSVGRRFLHGRIVAIAARPQGDGYWLLSSTGHVYGFGGAHSYGSLVEERPRARGRARVASRGHFGVPVAIAATDDGLGYWIATVSGQVSAFGSARQLGPGSRSGTRPLMPAHVRVTAVVAAPSGVGFWLVDARGFVRGFGSSRSFGSVPPQKRAGTVVGMALAPDDEGYWLATATGALLPFGSARPLSPVTGVGPASGVVGTVSGP